MSTNNGPTRNASSKGAKTAPVWRSNTRSAEPCNWSDIEPNTLRGCVDAVARSGGAIMFGVTSDGGAYSVCVLHGSQKIKEYPHGKAECEEVLQNMLQWFADMSL